MKKFLLVISMILLMATTAFAVNTQTSYRTSTAGVVVNHEEASVDTDPGASGAGCVPVSIQFMRGEKPDEIWFYVKSIGTGATITLQWSDDAGVTYYDYPTTRYEIEVGGRDIIRDRSAGVYWKLMVKDNEQGSGGASVFGISW